MYLSFFLLGYVCDNQYLEILFWPDIFFDLLCCDTLSTSARQVDVSYVFSVVSFGILGNESVKDVGPERVKRKPNPGGSLVMGVLFYALIKKQHSKSSKSLNMRSM